MHNDLELIEQQLDFARRYSQSAMEGIRLAQLAISGLLAERGRAPGFGVAVASPAESQGSAEGGQGSAQGSFVPSANPDAPSQEEQAAKEDVYG